jgi:cysteine desulfurase
MLQADTPFPPVLYFDHNATHPLSAAARKAWLEASERFIGNPSSPHRIGSRAEAALTAAREKLAAWLKCEPLDIIWTSGATESNNTAIHSLSAQGAGDMLVSAIEHPCLNAAVHRHFGGKRQVIPVKENGVIDLEWLAKALRASFPRAVAVMAANNETGVLQPWREALALCQEHRVPFFCDAAQWLGKLPANGLGACDFVSGCAHKFGGPQGVGFLKVPKEFRSLIVGGPQEEGRRAGTENVAGVIAMVAALEQREGLLSTNFVEGRTQWRAEFESALAKALPGTTVIASDADRLWNTVAAIMPALEDCRQRWVVKLDKLGFAVSTGSACASGKEQPSHVLAAMDFSADDASRVLRFSSGFSSTREDWHRLLDGLRQAQAELAQ